MNGKYDDDETGQERGDGEEMNKLHLRKPAQQNTLDDTSEARISRVRPDIDPSDVSGCKNRPTLEVQ